MELKELHRIFNKSLYAFHQMLDKSWTKLVSPGILKQLKLHWCELNSTFRIILNLHFTDVKIERYVDNYQRVNVN